MRFEEKLIKLRKEKALSQEELGEKLEVTRQTISKWELGESKPDMDKLIAISKFFEVDIAMLTNEEYEYNKGKSSKKGNKTWLVVTLIIVALIILVILVILTGGIISCSQNKRASSEEKPRGLINNFFNIFDRELNMVDKGLEMMEDGIDNMMEENNKTNQIINENEKEKEKENKVEDIIKDATGIINNAVEKENIKNEAENIIKDATGIIKDAVEDIKEETNDETIKDAKNQFNKLYEENKEQIKEK